MALVLANRVQELATANTTVSFTLTGAVLGFQSFASVGNGNTTYYSAFDGSGNWEVGLGTYSTTGPTLTRTTVYASSASGSAVTFSGSVTVFLTYPSGRSVNLDASGNVSALGTVSSGTWQGSTVGVAYGGTGVTASSGANSVVLRDADQNISVNSVTQARAIVTAAAGTTTLTTASAHFQILVGTGTQTFQLPDATLLPTGSSWVFDNDSTGNLTVTDNASATLDVVPPGGYSTVFLEANGTVGGTWGKFGMIPSEVNWGTNSLDLGGSTIITNGTWQGNTIQPGYGGTGLTTFTGANNALYSTGASTLTAGTLPVAAGGTGLTTLTANYVPYGNGTSAFQSSANMQFNGTTLTLANDASISGLTVGKGAGSISTNTAVGASALAANTSGTYNVALGSQALQAITTASYNTAVGAMAGSGNTTGANNTSVGFVALSASGIKSNNTAIGASALSFATTGSSNTAVGNNSGLLITTGSKNTIIGSYTGNQGGLDIRTASNYIVLSDGDGNPRAYWNGADPSFPGNLTLSGGTANGVAYLNGSKVLTTGSALTFDGTNFATTGTIRSSSTNGNIGATGTTGSATLALTTNARLWTVQTSNSDSALYFRDESAGSERMRIDSSGNVGIGTSSPLTKVQATGEILASNSSYSGSTQLVGARLTGSFSGTTTGIDMRRWTGAATNHGTGAMVTDDAAAIIWYSDVQSSNTAATTERMRLTTTGLGIGTSSPGFKLQVIGTSQLSLSAAGTQQALQLNNSDTTAGTQAVKLGFSSSGVTKASINAAVYGNDYMTFNVGSDTERMRLDSSGNLGLGVTPSAWGGGFVAFEGNGFALTSSDAVSNHLVANAYRNSSNWYYKGNGFAMRYRQLNGEHNWFTAANNSSGAGAGPISWTQAMTLDASGNLSVGTTSATATTGINVWKENAIFGNGGGATGPRGGFYSSSTYVGMLLDDSVASDGSGFGSGTDYFYIERTVATGNVSLKNSSSTGAMIFGTGASGTERARIDSSGLVLIGTTSASGSNLLQVNSDALVNGLTVGKGAGSVSTNTAVGASALYVNSGGTLNTAVGSQALYLNNTGSGNTAVGLNSLYSNSTGANNSAFGVQALGNNTTNSNMTAVGYQTAYNMRGNNNSAFGYQAMLGSGTPANNTGINNVAQGYQSLYSLTSGYSNVAIGYQSLYNATTTPQNVAVGLQALYNLTTAGANVAVGYSALYGLSSGTGNNTAIGYQAGFNPTGLGTTASNNVFVGYVAGQGNVGSGNTFLGYGSGQGDVNNPGAYSYAVAIGWQAIGYPYYASAHGSYNIGIGYNAGYQSYNGSTNIWIGESAGYLDYYSSNSVKIGSGAGYSANSSTGAVLIGKNAGNQAQSYDVAIGGYTLDYLSGGYNTAVGVEALGNMSGYQSYMTAIGAYALLQNTTGTNNTAVGGEALRNNTTQNNQTAVGRQAMYNMQGGANVGIGVGALYGSGTVANNTGTYNIAIGYQTLYFATSAANNVAVGSQALYNNSTGSGNTAFGHNALYNNTTSSNNTAIGYQALYTATTVGNNVAVGYQSLFSTTFGTQNTAIGYQAFYSIQDGLYNTAIGYQAGYNSNGSNNIAIGYTALYSVQLQNANIAIGAGSQYFMRGYSNVAIGDNVMVGSSTPANNTASNSVAIGTGVFSSLTSGNYNIGLGYRAGYQASGGATTNAITSGANNIYVGAYAYPSSATVSNEIVIGYGSTGKGASTGYINPNSGGVYQGNNSTTWSTTSDARIKQNFIPVDNGLEIINALEPLEFDYILTGKHDVGFKAQDYMQVLPSQVGKHAASAEEKELVGEGEIYGIQRNLDPYLVSAIKALTAQVKQLQQEIAQLKGA